METLSVPFEVKADANKVGKFSGYGAVFNNTDLGNDIILPGAFKEVRKTGDGKLRIALNHNLRTLVGKADFRQDDHGLHIDGQINMDVSYAKDAYHLMKDGTLDGMSVGFNILKGGADFQKKDDEIVRVISKAELWEVSVVPFGMNPEALVDSVKSEISDIRAFESFLHEHGFSRKEAKAIASGGFRAYQRDVGVSSLKDSTSEMLADNDVQQIIAAFKV
jgi:HK97 family phage prohead protease